MAKMLDKLAKQFMQKERQDASASVIDDAAYLGYEESLKGKRSFTCRFEMADVEGNLSLVDANGIKVVLKAETFKQDAPYYSKRIKDRFIGTIDLSVVASQIDKKNGVVYVESSVDKSEIKGSLLKEIFTNLKKGVHPRLAGIVISVTDDRAMINILNRNILGYLNAANYQPIYTRSLREVLAKGDYVEFEVVEVAKKREGMDYMFYLDRRNIVEDPWLSLPDFPNGSSIVCKCVDKPKDRDFWWGTSKSVPGIEIICNYSDHVSVMKSCYYKCKVRHYDKEKHILKVVPFEVVPNGIATEANIMFAKSKKARS